MDLKILNEGDFVFAIKECKATVYIQRPLEGAITTWECAGEVELSPYWHGVIVESKLPYLEYKVKKTDMVELPVGNRKGKPVMGNYYLLINASYLRKSTAISSLLT